MPKVIKRTLPIAHLRSQISDATVNEETRTIDLVWSTGFKGLRSGWDGKYYEELSMDPTHVDMSRLQNGAPVLNSHNSWDTSGVIGVVESARIENGKGMATIRFAKDVASDEVFQKVKDKILRNVSVGYSVAKYEDVSEKGDQLRTYRATKWTPMEISIVPIGFDPGAQTRQSEIETEIELEQLTANDPVGENNIGGPVMDELEKQRQLEEMEKAKKEAAETAIKAFKQRQTDIRSIVKQANLDESFADELIGREDVDVNMARKLTLEKLAASQPEPVNNSVRIEIGTEDRDKKRDAIVDAVLSRVDKQNFKQTQGNPFLHFSLLRMMEALISRNGMSDARFATRAMSSSDLPYILANVAEKSAQAKYQLQPRTWSRWALTDTLRNYKTADKIRSGDFASLLERKENGEFKRGSFGEEREQVQLKDWGIILPFTRQMLINDDLGEISKVTSQSGVAASRLENRLVYEILTSNPTMGDGIALFHNSHGNLDSGAALSDTSIGSAFQKMREQKTVDGLDYLNVAPKYLLCGPLNEVLARKYLAQISPTQASNVNVFSSSLELIVDSEISTNDYFFAADQNLIPTVTLYHLEGEEQPRVESRIDFETESVEIKCAHAAIAAANDFRGLVKNPNVS